MADKLKPDALITPFMSNARPAAKMVGWAAGIGATAFAASYLTNYNDSNLTASEDAENNGRFADIKQLDLPISSRLHGSPSTVIRDFLLAAGGVCGLLGVAGGAFGFHGLKRVIAHRGQSTQDLLLVASSQALCSFQVLYMHIN
ncbi:g4042 [Coccomyxa elongata]